MAVGKKTLEIIITASAKKAERVFANLKRGMKAVTSAGIKIGAGIAAGFGVAGIAFAALTSKILNTEDALAKTARRLGVTTQELIALRTAGGFAGASMQDIDNILKFMQKNLAELKDGTAEQVDAFDKLGISIDDVAGLSQADVFKKIVSALGAMEDQSDKTQVAMTLLGRSGAAVFNLTEANIARAEKEAIKFGLAMDKVSSDEVEQINDNISTIKNALSGFETQVIAALSAPFLKASESVKAFIESGNLKLWATQTALSMVQGFQGVIQTVGVMGEAIIAAGRALNLLKGSSSVLVGAFALRELKAVNAELETAKANLEELKAAGGAALGSDELLTVQRLTTEQGKYQALLDSAVGTTKDAGVAAEELAKKQGTILAATDRTVASLKRTEQELQSSADAQNKVKGAVDATSMSVEAQTERVNALAAAYGKVTREAAGAAAASARIITAGQTSQPSLADIPRVEG